MGPMKVHFTPASAEALRQTPLFSPVLVTTKQNGAHGETAFAMRVDELFSFRRPPQSFLLKCIGYQGKEGIWVVAVAFLLGTVADRWLEGRVYLNPRRQADYIVLQSMALQEHVSFFFVNESLGSAVPQDRTWSVEERYGVRLLLSQIERAGHAAQSGQSELENTLRGEDDPEFDCAKEKFHTRVSLCALLATRTSLGQAVSPVFRGAVLE